MRSQIYSNIILSYSKDRCKSAAILPRSVAQLKAIIYTFVLTLFFLFALLYTLIIFPHLVTALFTQILNLFCILLYISFVVHTLIFVAICLGQKICFS